VTYRVAFASGAAAQFHNLPEHARDAVVHRPQTLPGVRGTTSPCYHRATIPRSERLSSATATDCWLSTSTTPPNSSASSTSSGSSSPSAEARGAASRRTGGYRSIAALDGRQRRPMSSARPGLRTWSHSPTFGAVRERPWGCCRAWADACERARTPVLGTETRKVGGSIPPLPTAFPLVRGLQRLHKVPRRAETTETTRPGN
jgi:hypothetical protein